MVSHSPAAFVLCCSLRHATKIPGYACWKLWGSVISPFVLGRGQAAPSAEDEAVAQPTSKRQEKLRKRQERGDPRVQTRAR